MDNNAFTEFNTFLTTTPGGQMLLNLAASYAFQLLEAGRGWVTAQALGKPAQRGLHDAAQFAFAALLHEARKSYPHNREVHEEAVGAAMQRLLAQPGVADRLLADALTAAELDLPWLEAQFVASGAAERLTAIPFDVRRCFRAWHAALAAALEQAAAANAALFPPWLVANAVAVRDKLDVVAAATARIETATVRIEEKIDQLTPKSTRVPERWRVPFLRNDQFVGREQDLVDLHAALQGGTAVGIRPAGLTGLGGIGKTQLAVEYCYRYRDAYPGGVFWINAAGDWLNTFADLGLFLDEELYGKALDRQARAAAAYFAAHTDSLLVLDNVLDPAHLRVPVTPDLTPAALPCRVLFTTRRRDLGDFQPIELSVLPEKAGLHLLLRYPARQPALDLGHPENAAAVTIYSMLGGLPLALEIAGAHLGRFDGQSINAYCNELRKRGALAVMDDPKGKVKSVDLGTRHAAAVVATLKEQWAGLQNDDSRLLLRVAGQLPEAELIPAARLGLLAGVSNHNDSFFGTPLSLALGELHDAALVERLAGDNIRLHPLVRDFANLHPGQTQVKAFRSWCAANLLAAYRNFDTIESNCANRGNEALEADIIAAIELIEGNDDLSQPLNNILRMLRREGHVLRGWNADLHPSHFAQRWNRRSAIECDIEMANLSSLKLCKYTLRWTHLSRQRMDEK